MIPHFRLPRRSLTASDPPVSLDENAEPTVTTLRIRVENRKITEAEWFVIDTNKIRHVYSIMFYPPND